LATWWRQKSPGSYYWRCKTPAKRLPGQVLWFTDSDLAEENGRIVFPRQRGAAIWQFPGNATTGTLIAGMQEEGIRVFVELDDSYLHRPETMSSDWQEELDRSPADRYSFEAHRRICEFVDGIIVSTPELAELYGQVNPNVHVCPNSMVPEDWPEPAAPQEDGVLRIGWPGSHSHLHDAPLVRRAFRWVAEQRNVEVWVVGIGDIYKFPGAVKRVPWIDNQDDYRAALGRLDVIVCPLIETKWSRYKSDLKALEAGMVGAWPIVSTAAPYAEWQHRTMTCTTAKDWEHALRWVVRHRDEIPALAAGTRNYVLSERTIDHSIGRWKEAIQ